MNTGPPGPGGFVYGTGDGETKCDMDSCQKLALGYCGMCGLNLCRDCDGKQHAQGGANARHTRTPIGRVQTAAAFFNRDRRWSLQLFMTPFKEQERADSDDDEGEKKKN